MTELTEKDLAWRRGFEDGVAYTLRRFTKDGTSTINISEFILELEHLRLWKNHEEWRELMEKNIKIGERNG